MFKMTTVSVNAQFKTVDARGPKIALYLKSHHWFNKQYIKAIFALNIFRKTEERFCKISIFYDE